MSKTLTDGEKDILKKYMELKSAAREINTEINDLKEPVRDALVRVEAQNTPVASEIGALSLRPRRKWTYSEETEALMEKVKSQQKLEEATGKATFVTNYDVYFK